MKNIHLVPTPHPSNITIQKRTSKLLYDLEPFTHDEYDVISNQNICITSNEEIKEGFNQWYLDRVLNKPYNSGGAQYAEKQDVIILTTDQDLIKDGVQAIDDEFLEWFVKNPNCEEVEVQERQQFEPDKTKRENPLNGVYYSYKLIIPKEEPKQETLEEAIKREYEARKFDSVFPFDPQSFALGAEWKAEQDKNKYSEEEMQKAFVSGALTDLFNTWNISNENMAIEKFKEWFEPFKK